MNIRKSEIIFMIFLYFFIAIILIVGIYLIVDFSIKYSYKKKAEKEADKRNESAVTLIQYCSPIVCHDSLEVSEINSKIDDELNYETTVNNISENVNKEELISRLKEVLTEVAYKQQYEMLLAKYKLILETHIAQSKKYYETKHLRHYIRRRPYFRSDKNETDEINGYFSHLDVHIGVIEDYLTNCANEYLISYCEKYKKKIDFKKLNYSVVINQE